MITLEEWDDLDYQEQVEAYRAIENVKDRLIERVKELEGENKRLREILSGYSWRDVPMSERTETEI